MKACQQQWMGNGRLRGDERVDAVRKSSTLTLEPERNVFPLAMEQCLILTDEIPQRSTRDIQTTAAEGSLRKIVVVGVEHTVGVVHAGLDRRLDPALLSEQLVVRVPLGELV